MQPSSPGHTVPPTPFKPRRYVDATTPTRQKRQTDDSATSKLQQHTAKNGLDKAQASGATLGLRCHGRFRDFARRKTGCRRRSLFLHT